MYNYMLPIYTSTMEMCYNKASNVDFMHMDDFLYFIIKVCLRGFGAVTDIGRYHT